MAIIVLGDTGETTILDDTKISRYSRYMVMLLFIDKMQNSCYESVTYYSLQYMLSTPVLDVGAHAKFRVSTILPVGHSRHAEVGLCVWQFTAAVAGEFTPMPTH